MSVGAEKVVGITPAEFADQIQGRRHTARLTGYQAAVAAAVLDIFRVDRPMRVRRLQVKLLTAGTAGQTDVDVRVIRKGDAGPPTTILLAPLVIDNAVTDPTEASAANFVTVTDEAKLEPGDILQLEVTAAPTAGADLYAQVDIDERADPPVERPLLGP